MAGSSANVSKKKKMDVIGKGIVLSFACSAEDEALALLCAV